MKTFFLKAFLAILFCMPLSAVIAQSLQHPAIWITPDEKADFMTKYNSYSWAKGIITKAKSAIDSRVNTHISNPLTILNTIPALATTDKLSESDASSVNAAHARVLNYASYAAMVYYVTGEQKYAQFAADILWYYIEVVAPRTPQTTAFSGNDFYDARCGYAHFSIAYDFLVNYLKEPTTKLYQKSTGNKVSFDNVVAQKAIYNIAMNALGEHGGTDKLVGKDVSNHPVLRAPGVLFSILNVENDTERERMFNVFWNVGTSRQNSFTRTILPMFGEQGIWPESVSYGFMPNITMILNLVDRLKPQMNVMNNYMNILNGNFLFDNLRLPDRRFVRYGDSHRTTDGTDEIYTYTLNLARRRGFAEHEQKAVVALRQAYNAQAYNPGAPISSFDNYSAFAQLFWAYNIPTVVEGKIDFQTPTVVIKHAGVALQRNYVENNNKEYGLCGIIGGANYVHAQLTGITMELYGAGYVMAANGGLPEGLPARQYPEHKEYFTRYAGNNTIVVNGTSHGIQQGWGGEMYQNTTVNIAAEPKHLEDPISKNFSFATQFLDDNVNNCDQQRTLSTIRTSPTTAYYFDMFRSKSNVTNNFHDYIYHNLGDAMHIFDKNNQELSTSTTTRYQTDNGDTFKTPGWIHFENTTVTAPTNEAVKVRFDLNYNKRYMHMMLPQGVEREYAKSLSYPTREALNGYVDKKTQIVTIRQQGEAWDKPYVSIFEPSASNNSSVTEVEHLYYGEAIIGAKVTSQVGNKTVQDYILCMPNANSSVVIPTYGISFSGRFAIVRYEQDLNNALTTLYIGEGDSLMYGDFELKTDETKKGIAEKAGIPYFGRQLLFKNINNNDVVAKGTNLSIEAIVGEEYTEATLWANDTINLGTKTEVPYVWSGNAILTNMQDDEYKFTLIAKDAQGITESNTIVVTTPGQLPYTEGQVPHPIPGKIEFEAYDAGGENLGYYDKTEQNTALYTYRDTDKVDLGRNGTAISSTEAGEWLEYTVNVAQSGYYELKIRHNTTIIPNVTAFDLILPNKGDTLLRNVKTLYTGRTDYFEDKFGEILLNEGKQVLRFALLGSNFNLDYMNFTFVRPSAVNNITDNQSKIRIYPNPAKEAFTIDLNGINKAEVAIYNTTGQLMLKKSTSEDKIYIPTGLGYKPGVYFIKVTDEYQNEFYNKLIIK